MVLFRPSQTFKLQLDPLATHTAADHDISTRSLSWACEVPFRPPVGDCILPVLRPTSVNLCYLIAQ